MGPYFFIYALSTISMVLSEYFGNKSIYLKKLFVVISILSLGVFLGFSNIDVGIDKVVYANDIFSQATTTISLKKLFWLNANVEKGYLFFNWVVGAFTNNIHFFYFIYGICICSMFYFALKLFNDNFSLSFSWLLFLIMFFPITLCLFRQSIAVALVSLSISLCINKKKQLIPIILIVIATQFHSSAVIGFVFFLIVCLFEKKNLNFKNQFVFLLILAMIFRNASTVMPWLESVGLLNDRYVDYVNGFLANPNSPGIGISVIFIFLGLFYLKEMKEDRKFNIAYFLSIINIFIYPLESISAVLGRLGFYFKFFLIIYYCFLVKNVVKDKVINLKKASILAVLVLYLVFSNNNYVMGLRNQQEIGTFQIYPYESNVFKDLFQ